MVLCIGAWPWFTEFVNLRFGPPIRSNGLAELKELHRTGSVEEYLRQFSSLLCRDDLTMSQQVNLFTTGLGQPLRTDVGLQAPSNLQMAMSLARAYEQRGIIAEGSQDNGAIKAVAVWSDRQANTAAPSKQQANAPQAVASARPRFRRLSAKELAAKRIKNECFYCPEKFTPGHKCSNSKAVFLLQLDEDQDIDSAVEDLGISLHALTGIGSTNTMQLEVVIWGIKLVALVDSVSTHTFINQDMVASLSLQIAPRPGLSVKVANGDRVTSVGVCINTTLHIGEETFNIDCFSIPLAGFDLVLGIQ